MNWASYTGWAMSVLLTSVRVGVLFLAVPPFGAVRIPVMVRVVLVLVLASALVGPGGGLKAGLEPVSLIGATLHEAVVGGAIALGLFSAFGAFQFAGRLLDLQIGFGVASLVDLATRSSAPLLGTVLSMMAAVYLFAIDGHLALLRLVKLSLEKLPAGTGIGAMDPSALLAQFGSCFAFGFVIVAPVILCLFLVDVGMSFMSRTMPQMNVFVMSMSLKVLVGLFVLATSVPFANGVSRRVFENAFETLTGVVGH